MRDLVSESEFNDTNFEEPKTLKFKSKVGQKFGHLTVLKLAGKTGKFYDYFCKCTCGNVVSRNASNLTPKNLERYPSMSCGCQMNKDKRVPLSEMIRRVKENTNYEVLESSELWESKWLFSCKDHGKFKMNYASVQNGKYGCPNCATFGFNPTQPAVFYVNAIVKDDNIVAYKYGITSQDLKDRLKQIVSKSEYKIVNVYQFKEIGSVVQEIELLVKTLVKSNYLTKDQIKSGFTETVRPDQIIIISQILNYIERINHGTSKII